MPGAGYTDEMATSPDTSAADTSGGGGWLSGLQGVFQAAGTAITTVYRTINPPTPTQVPSGGVIYNPKTGNYQPAVQQPPGTTISTNTLLLIGVGVLAVVLLMRR